MSSILYSTAFRTMLSQFQIYVKRITKKFLSAHQHSATEPYGVVKQRKYSYVPLPLK